MAKYRAVNGKLLLIKIPIELLNKINEAALRRQDLVRSKVIQEFFEWGFDKFLAEVITKESSCKTHKKEQEEK